MTELLPGMEGERRSVELSQWFTPPKLAQHIVEWALLPYRSPVWAASGVRALEPSAGRGALAIPLLERVKTVTCVDVDFSNVQHLGTLGFEALCADFLELWPAVRFDLAVMNPPFEGGQTEAHILHALKHCPRVVCHCPLTTLCGVERHDNLWKHVELHRLAICSSRPKYGAKGGMTDMCTIDVTLHEHGEDREGTDVEWWP